MKYFVRGSSERQELSIGRETVQRRRTRSYRWEKAVQAAGPVKMGKTARLVHFMKLRVP